MPSAVLTIKAVSKKNNRNNKPMVSVKDENGNWHTTMFPKLFPLLVKGAQIEAQLEQNGDFSNIKSAVAVSAPEPEFNGNKQSERYRDSKEFLERQRLSIEAQSAASQAASIVASGVAKGEATQADIDLSFVTTANIIFNWVKSKTQPTNEQSIEELQDTEL